jgi:hypothetical protein
MVVLPTASYKKRIPDKRPEEGATMGWITRARPKTDRIACPWLLRRFIDQRRRSCSFRRMMSSR